MLTFMFHITVKTGYESTAIATLAAIEKAAHQDAGCRHFVWLQQQHTPRRFTLFEQWESQEALDAHKAKGMAQWQAFEPCLDGDPVSEEFRLVAPLAQRLTEDEIRAFVTAWFDKLSRHVAVEELLPMLADDDLHMVFPEKTLRNQAAFRAWYAEVGRAYSHQEHLLEQLTIQNNAAEAALEVVVVWRAENRSDAARLAMRAVQSWTVKRSAATGQPIILTYLVRSLENV
jgi:quinol monooxygenase YgiN